MKKVLICALMLLVCVCSLTSCAQVEQEIGKTMSVSALDKIEQELKEQGYEVVREHEVTLDNISYGPGELPELAGALTGTVVGTKADGNTSVITMATGLSATADVESLAQYYRTQLAEEIEAEQARVETAGWVVSVTIVSSFDAIE